MGKNGRNTDGRFAEGNSGGPGRPRRPVEAEYLAALSEAVTLDTWREVVSAAVEQAKAGDDKSRAWLSRYLLGESPASLRDLAKRDLLGISQEHELRAECEADMQDPTERLLADTFGLTPIRRARSIASDATGKP